MRLNHTQPFIVVNLTIFAAGMARDLIDAGADGDVGLIDRLPAYCEALPALKRHLLTGDQLITALMRNYSRQMPALPVSVKVEVTIQDIVELSVLSNSFTADLWFSAIWQDPRLVFVHLDPCRRNLSFDDTFERRLWSPNVCLVNTKSARIHSSPKPNVLLMLLSNGTVWLNYRIRVEAPCLFKLSDFPMDRVECSLVFESYSYNTATVMIDWMPEAITLYTTDFTAADFSLIGHRHYNHTKYYKAGKWYQLTLDISFARNYGFYLLQIYATMYINVFLSWIAFCISLKALPARVILSMHTLMSICLQFDNIISSLPPVSDVKSIDYFMFACIAYIFASLLEMAFIAYQSTRLAAQEERYIHDYIAQTAWQKRKLTFLDHGTRIDRISFIIFPVTFGIFNIAYWTYCLTTQLQKPI